MSTSIILLTLILPLLWNILTVTYLTHQARGGRLSPLKFTLAFILGFSITVSAILLIVITKANGVSLNGTGFVLFVFVLNFIIGFPTVYLLSRFLMKTKFAKWSSQINVTKEK